MIRSLRKLLGQSTRAGAYPETVAVSNANLVTAEFVRSVGAKSIAEFGIYKGFTSLELARALAGTGQLHLFDFSDRVNEVLALLGKHGFSNVRGFGSSYKYLDSYNWTLAQVLAENPAPVYDYAFLDGAHTWAIDALTFLLVDRLLKPGGHVDFDDYDWTLAGSPSMNPDVFPLTAKLYPVEQIQARQVEMIVELLVRRDSRYREVVPNKIFQKIAP